MMRQSLFVALLVAAFTFSASRVDAITFDSFVFQTAADNGESPAVSGQFNGPLYVRERANENNPELEVRAFLQFNTFGITGTKIESATLNLHQNHKLNNVNSANMSVAQVATAWDPVTTKPTFNQAIVAGTDTVFGNNGPASAGPAVSIDHAIDVTSIVQDWAIDPSSNHGVRLAFAQNAFVGAAFDSVGPNAPTLEVEFTKGLISQVDLTPAQVTTAARNGDSPDNDPFGTSLSIRERNGDPGNAPQNQYRAFMQFDLDSLGDAEVLDAQLVLTRESTINTINNPNILLDQVLDDWNTTNDKPTYDQSSLQLGILGTALQAGDEFSLDVTALVQAWKDGSIDNNGFRIRMADAFQALSFFESGANGPRLEVTLFQQVPEPTTGMLALIAAGTLLRRRRSAA